MYPANSWLPGEPVDEMAGAPAPAVRDSMVTQLLRFKDAPMQARALAVGAWLERARQHGPAFYQECVQRSIQLLRSGQQVRPRLIPRQNDVTHFDDVYPAGEGVAGLESHRARGIQDQHCHRAWRTSPHRRRSPYRLQH